MSGIGNSLPEEPSVDMVFMDSQKLCNQAFFDSHKVGRVSGTLVETIGESFFYNSSVIEVDFPSLKEVGCSAFNSCGSLKNINLYGVQTIESSAFFNCQYLEEVQTSGDLNVIGREAFSSCERLKSISSLKSVTEVGERAFQGCSSLEKISLPLVKRIGAEAFKGCTKLKEIEIPCAEEIEEGAFEGCSALAEIRIPSSAKRIGNRAFAFCNSLLAVLISKETERYLPENAFEGCKKSQEELVINPSWNLESRNYSVKTDCEKGICQKGISLNNIEEEFEIGAITVCTDSGNIMVSLCSFDRNRILVRCMNLGEETVKDVKIAARVLLYQKN